MLADGKSLVAQVVPAELLDMSSNVLRRALANIWPRRIFTLAFGRYTLYGTATEARATAQALVQRLSHAREIGGIVLSTPTAVKSLFLAYARAFSCMQASLWRVLACNHLCVMPQIPGGDGEELSRP